MTIRQYCESKHISLKAFSEITGVSYDHLIKNIADSTNAPIEFETGKKIYDGTKKIFGVGLCMDQYTEIVREEYVLSTDKEK